MNTQAARFWRILVLGVFLSGAVAGWTQAEPPLPTGLEDDKQQQANRDEPALPAGLGEEEKADEPALPQGLGQAPAEEEETEEPEEKRFDFRELGITGFWEIRGGVRTQRDRHQKDASLAETRLQLDIERMLAEKFTFQIKADLLYDPVTDRHSVNLERGEGLLDLREANVMFTPVDFMDVKIGRQILTWGTGDLLFLNDMFPKDWQSFFIGRDVEYLKAPSDAVKLSFFSDVANWDVVFVPRFDPDRFITGRRLSYYNPLLMGRAGRNAVQQADIPNTWFEDHEWHTRISRNIKGVELAGYGYWGRWKSPGGMDFLEQKATFPRLNTYGGSIRGPLGGGIANLEVAYYDSREDREGNNRFIDNSEMRFLAGYERQLPEIASDLTVGGQYYVEWMMDYDRYRETLLPIMPARDEVRHVVTCRVTKLLLNQNLTLSLFAYYSPSDSDAYLRPSVGYKITDRWLVEAGGSVFFGADKHTFFNQFAKNSNVYVALRYSF